jgi:nitrogen fixation protein FixH
MTARASSPLSGRKVAAIFVAFFAVVIAVNFTMAGYASSTFGGVVVENSYVASQKYNTWLEAARRQQALGWSAQLARLPDNRVALRLAGAPEDGLSVAATARHPLGRTPDRPLALRRAGDGSFVSARPLPAGRWTVRIEARAGESLWREEEDLR